MSTQNAIAGTPEQMRAYSSTAPSTTIPFDMASDNWSTAKSPARVRTPTDPAIAPARGERRQEFLRNQLANRRPDHQFVEHIGQAFAVEPLGRRRDAEHHGSRPARQDLAPHAGDRMVRFIDDDQVRRLHFLEVAHQGCDIGNLHRPGRPLVAGGYDAVSDAELEESRRYLAHDFVTVGENEDLVASRNRPGDDESEQNSFARAGWRLVKHA